MLHEFKKTCRPSPGAKRRGLVVGLRLLAVVAASQPCPAAIASQALRVATFNVALYGQAAGELQRRLQSGDDRQLQCLAEIIQRTRPAVLLLNEIDVDADGAALRLFCENYLARPQHPSGAPAGPAEAISFQYRYLAPTNTGEHAGRDLSGDGVVDDKPGSDAYAADCYGYGRYPGQYGFALLSQHPIDEGAIRTFRKFLWKDMPGALLPDNPHTPAAGDWYSAEALADFRLSSKNHCDVPVRIGDRTVHLLLAHPTPPVYDGNEDRNGRRNHDELRLWKDYVGDGANRPSENDAYLSDDDARRGGLPRNASFVILGDLNGDPQDGDGPEGIRSLLASPRLLRYPPPRSDGAAEQSALQQGANLRHRGDPACDTCNPADDPGPGNLRIDYVLPSADLKVAASGVFWPRTDNPLFPLVAGDAQPASSDHRLVWVDLLLPPPDSPTPRNPQQ